MDTFETVIDAYIDIGLDGKTYKEQKSKFTIYVPLFNDICFTLIYNYKTQTIDYGFEIRSKKV